MLNFDRRKCFTSFHTFSRCDTATSFTGKGNEMTTVYAEGDRNPLFKYVTVAKIGQGRPKSDILDVCHPAKHERSRASHRRNWERKTESKSMRFDFFAKFKVTYMYFIILPCKTIPSCTTVAVIASEIWDFNVFSLNVCHRHKSRPRSSEYVQRFGNTQICPI